MSFPVVFRTAHDCILEDIEGKKYIDFISGYGVVNTGWQRKAILEEMARQMEEGCFAPPWLPTQQAVRLAEALLAISPKNIHKCVRATGGAEAIEAAIRALYVHRGGSIVTLRHAYHGGTSGALSAGDVDESHLPFSPLLDRMPKVPPAYCFRCYYGKKYPGCSLECAEAIETFAKNHKNVTGLIMEPVIGSGGVIVPPAEYFTAVREICQRRQITLIFDEVMTGFGRVGAFFAATCFDIEPDVITIAKGLGAGYVPIGAALMNRDIAESLEKYQDVSATFAWTPLACAAALANLRILQEEKLPDRARTTGRYLIQEFREICERYIPEHIGEIRGLGLMIGIELIEDQKSKNPASVLGRKFLISCRNKGLMIGTTWDWHTLVIMPPLTIGEELANQGLEIFEASLKRLRKRA